MSVATFTCWFYLVVLFVTFTKDVSVQARSLRIVLPPNFDKLDNTQTYRIKVKLNSKKTTTTKAPLEFMPRGQEVRLETVSESCGYSVIKLIQGGENALPGEFPWLGALFRINVTPKEYVCTVNLISRKHLLTAAHCFSLTEKPENYHVVLGHLMSEPHQSLGISNIVKHPQYNHRPEHDIAILSLNTDVQFSTSLRPICLQLPNSARNNSIGIVSGFGPNYTTYRKIRMPLVPKMVCHDTHAVFRELITENSFCAGSRDNMGPCSGDSGAGFMQEVDGRLYLRGVVSSSLPNNGSCDLRSYIIFADLINDLTWLKNLLQKYL